MLQADPGNTDAIAGLARTQIEAGDLAGAEATLGLIPDGKENDTEIASARAALELLIMKMSRQLVVPPGRSR